MRYLKEPKAKKNDPTTPWVQEGFTNIYRDTPASEIPKDGLADSINGLLFGDRVVARPGYEKYKDYALPIANDGRFSDVSKADNVVTDHDSDFDTTDVGGFLIWPSGNVDQIVGYNSSSEVIVDNDTVENSFSCNFRGQLFGDCWHEKSLRIIIHIGTKLYYTENDFASGWVEIPFPQGVLQSEISQFDIDDDYVFIFNSAGIYQLDLTDPDSISVMKMNDESPSNSIILDSSVRRVGSPLTEVDVMATKKETGINHHGRYYIFSLSRLAGNWQEDRGDGNRIIKETGTNLATKENEYLDYKTSWRMDGFETNDAEYGSRENILAALRADDYTYGQLQYFSNPGLNITVTAAVYAPSASRNVPFLNPSNNESWFQIAAAFQKGLRNAFPEVLYLKVLFDEVNQKLLLVGGEDQVYISAISEPTDLYSSTSYNVIFNSTYDLMYGERYKTLGLKGTKALGEIGYGTNGYTHYSVYSTRTDAPQFRISKSLNEDGELISTPTPVDMSSFIWQNDIPIIRPFLGIIISGGYLYADDLPNTELGSWISYEYGAATTKSAKYVFPNSDEAMLHDNGTAIPGSFKASSFSNASTQEDILVDTSENFITKGVEKDDLIYNLTTGERAFVDNVTATQLTLSEEIFDIAGGQQYLIGYPALAIGSEEPLLVRQSGTTLLKLRGPAFTSLMVGQIIFLSDGTFNVIQEFVSSTTVKLLNSTTFDRLAAAVKPSGRNYNDNINDVEIESRAVSLPANNRFATALPDSNLGVFVAGFMAVANEDEMRGYYSQHSQEFRYYIGHYQSDIQFFVMSDTIKLLDRMPDHLVVYCKNSTHKFQTNVVNDAGNGIAVLSGQSIVDENIGISDRQGVVPYSGGFKFVITSEPGLRQFDGYRYGENMLFDERGKSHINRDIQVLKSRIALYYEPNLYGMMMWGIDTDYEDIDDSPVLSRSTKCFRMAIERQHGFGFAELNGTDWLWIEVNAKPLRITDSNQNKITIVFDSKEGYPHRLSTRKLPNQGSSSEIDLNFSDKEDIGGSVGTEISGSIKLREHIAKEEHWRLRYIEEYWYLRPYYESDGFRDAQQLTIKAYTDGAALEASEIYYSDPKATIYQPYDLQERRIQIEFLFAASGLIITGTNALYDTLKRRVAPEHTINEITEQEWIQNIIFRLSRGSSKTLDLATGTDNTEEFLYLEAQGPDGDNNSAFRIMGGNASYTAPESWARQLIFSIKPAVDPGTGLIYAEDIGGSNYRLEIVWNGVSGIDVNFNNSIMFNLAVDVGAWQTFMITVSKDGTTISWRKATPDLTFTSGSTSRSGSSEITASNSIIIGSLVDREELFDILLIDSTENELDEKAFQYYARDVHKYAGYSLLPIADCRPAGITIIESGDRDDDIVESAAQTINYIEGG